MKLIITEGAPTKDRPEWSVELGLPKRCFPRRKPVTVNRFSVQSFQLSSLCNRRWHVYIFGFWILTLHRNEYAWSR